MSPPEFAKVLIVFPLEFGATMHSKDHEKVIRDFGQQWTHYTDNSGYYGSLEFFRDSASPLSQFPSSAACMSPK